MTTRLHSSSRLEKVTTCFVLNDCIHDSGILADVADQSVLLPKESTEQTLLTPTASTASSAVDTRKESVSDVCAVDNDRLIVTDYKSGWDTRFKSGVYRGMPNGVILRDYPKQVEPPIEVKSVSRNMREFLPGTQEHHRTDATTSIFTAQNRRTDIVALRLSECKELSRKVRKNISPDQRARFVDSSQNASHITTGFNDRFKNTRGSHGETVYRRKGYITPITEPTLIPSA